MPDLNIPEIGEDALADRERYAAALHAVQSGVAIEMQIHPGQVEPKQLRVGVNSAMVEHAALTRLLIAKGVITWAEYFASLADTMEAERDLYAARLSAHYGRPVTLA